MFIVNKNIPAEAFERLGRYGKVAGFETKGITYPEVSSHADLFFCTDGKTLVMAPNTPQEYQDILSENGITYSKGKMPTGMKYPESAGYNAVVTEKYLIHHLKITDPVILEIFHDREKIHVQQGYTRCSLLPLSGNRFITSDQGIYKILHKKNLPVLYTDPKEILLPGFDHGLIGGTAGIYNNNVFFTGSLNHLRSGEQIRSFIELSGMEIIELYDGPLFDAGSILRV
jgi:hypothetical protein